MVTEDSKRTIEALEQGRYINNSVISLGGFEFSARDVLVKAPLIAGLNTYYVGGTGEGKTQLGHDLLSLAGENGCYAMGRPDFEPGDLLRQVNLENIRKAKTDKDLIQLTENVRKNVFLIDELNRCPPIVQNYFFDFFDGKMVYNGKTMKLGDGKYSVGFATGNLGDGEYVGVSESDRALLDRLHLIIKLDHPDYRPTNLNMLELFMSGKKNPRTESPQDSSKVTLQNILELNTEFGKREVDFILPTLGVYLTRGLDYLENVSGHSKKALDTRWPRIEGIREDTDENKLFPLSPRAVFSAMGLSSALEMIAEAKQESGKLPETLDKVELFLDSLRLTAPYSGVLAQQYIEQEYNGSVYSAFDSLVGKDSSNRREIREKVPLIESALCYALAGERENSILGEIAPIEGRWKPVAQSIGDLADKNKESSESDVISARHILKKIKIGGN